MFPIAGIVSNRLYAFVRRYAPTNMLLAAIFTRRGLKWGMLAIPLAAGYVVAALLCGGLAEQGEAEWINLLVLLFSWNAVKFVVAAPVSLVYLVRARVGEAGARRMLAIPARTAGPPLSLTSRVPARVFH